MGKDNEDSADQSLPSALDLDSDLELMAGEKFRASESSVLPQGEERLCISTLRACDGSRVDQVSPPFS